MITLELTQPELQLIQAALEILIEASEINEITLEGMLHNLKPEQAEIRPAMVQDLNDIKAESAMGSELLIKKVNPLIQEDIEDLPKPTWGK